MIKQNSRSQYFAESAHGFILLSVCEIHLILATQKVRKAEMVSNGEREAPA